MNLINTPRDIRTEAQLRALFWQNCPHLRCAYVNGARRPVRAPQNLQPADTRMAWVDFVDACARDGRITEALAARATL